LAATVAEERGIGGDVPLVPGPGAGAGAQLVHREGEDVGRARLTHPLLVQHRHRLLVDDQDGQLGERVDAHPLQHVPGQRDDKPLVDLDAGLVVYLDAHCSLMFSPGSA
jgi:hypothetical protein